MPYKDPEKRKEAQRRWREKNKDKLKASKSRSYQKHKKQRDKFTEKYRNKYPWISFYTNAKQRCTNPKHPSYKNYGAKGIRFELTVDEVKELWFRDKAYKLESPSIDRKDADLNYSFDNCRFVDRWINVSKKVDSA